MSFFIKGKRKKVKTNFGNNNNGAIRRSSNKVRLGSNQNGTKSDEEIDSDVEDEGTVENNYKYSSESETEETVQEKRLRLAHKYLEEIEKQEKDRLDQDDVDRDVISSRLKEGVLEQAGKLRKQVAATYIGSGDLIYMKCKEHSRSVTCLVISSDNLHIYSASDDLCVVKWSVSEKTKLKVIKRGNKDGHTKKILSIEVSTDGRFLVTGDSIGKLIIWDADNMTHVKTFTGHRGPITGVAFRRDTHQLFSAATDKTVKIWNLDEMSYVETLFGHQCGITGLDALARDRAVTSGGRDSTVRLWKVPEESHLILNGHKESIDCIQLLTEDHMVSGSESGNVCLWSIMKKKPVFTLPLAHGVDPASNTAHWVISIATLPFTDLFASSSYNGLIQLYKCDEKLKSFEKLFQVTLEGNINCMRFTTDGEYLAAAVGQDGKNGRWHTVKTAKNAVVLIPLQKKEQTT